MGGGRLRLIASQNVQAVAEVVDGYPVTELEFPEHADPPRAGIGLQAGVVVHVVQKNDGDRGRGSLREYIAEGIFRQSLGGGTEIGSLSNIVDRASCHSTSPQAARHVRWDHLALSHCTTD